MNRVLLVEPKPSWVGEFDHGGLRWQELVGFRDALKKNAMLLKKYLQLKVQLAAQFPNDVNAYSEAKREFVHQCIGA